MNSCQRLHDNSHPEINDDNKSTFWCDTAGDWGICQNIAGLRLEKWIPKKQKNCNNEI